MLWQSNLLSLAQQIPSALLSFELFGLSDGCFAVANRTTATCPEWLPLHAGIGYPGLIIYCTVLFTDGSHGRELQPSR
jgi:hypothetical protein